MSIFPLACQTITFGPDQKEHFPKILRTIADAGYQGVEIGFRHLVDIAPKKFLEMLEHRKLSLTALHVGGNLLDPAQAEGEQREIERVLDYAVAIGSTMILYSGLKYENDLQFNNDLSMIMKSAELCAEREVRLLYHNHNWEFENDWKIMRTLLAEKSSPLGLCPDLGWVYRSGADVVAFLDAAGEAIEAVHFKDFSANDDSAVFTELGAGKAPLQEAANWLEENTDGMWVTLEQDKSELDPAEAVRLNAAYARSLFGNGG
jgi:sugar phosphate isomerase/epimerase